MNGILFFDTETTDKYDFKKPFDDPCQPSIIQIGAVLTGPTGLVVSHFSTLIKPEGWTISEEAYKIHDISEEACEAYGLPLKSALKMFSWLVSRAEILVAHNLSFDHGMFRTSYFRDGSPDPFKDKKLYCTMKSSTDICKIKGLYGNKWPTLTEAHLHFIGEAPKDTHDAMGDVLSCMAVYFKLKEGEKK